MTKRIRVPLVIWLRSKGLMQPFVWAVTQMRLRKARQAVAVSELPKDDGLVLEESANFNHASWLTKADSMCHHWKSLLPVES